MWVTGVLGKYWWQAKVYGEDSDFGITGGRISKLCICHGSHYKYDAMVYNYDRGLDFDNTEGTVLIDIMAEAIRVADAAKGDQS